MADLSSASVIGKPIPDLQVYILDPMRRPVPIACPAKCMSAAQVCAPVIFTGQS